MKIWLVPEKVKLEADRDVKSERIENTDQATLEDVRMLDQLSFATGATDQLSDEQPKLPEVKNEPPPSPKKKSAEEIQKEDLDKFHAEAPTKFRR